jgi:hypothetical protein
MIRDLLRLFIHPWVIVGAVLVAVVLSGVTWIALNNQNASNTPLNPATPSFSVIPASTPTAVIRFEVTPSPTPSPTEKAPPAPPPGTVVMGGYVQITGTGGSGLNLRSEPGLGGAVQYLGLESEVFIVRDGPVELDGFTWWYLAGFFDESRNGWGAANYLEVVQNP